MCAHAHLSGAAGTGILGLQGSAVHGGGMSTGAARPSTHSAEEAVMQVVQEACRVSFSLF